MEAKNELFVDGEIVQILEIFDGKKVRVGYVPNIPSTWYQKLWAWLGFTDVFTFIPSEDLTDLTNQYLKKNMIPGDLLEGLVVAQQRYITDFFATDLYIHEEKQTQIQLATYCSNLEIDMLPELYYGPFSQEAIKNAYDNLSYIDNSGENVQIKKLLVLSLSNDSKKAIFEKT